MNSLLRLTSLLCLSLIASLTLQAGGADWETNFEKAQERSKKENKPMLLDFTGSDWCGWCVKLNKEVFSKKEFTDFAKDKLVLVEIDFPSKKKLSKELRRQNDELQEKYNVKGYPTIILVSPEGSIIGKTGYKAGGPIKYIEHLEKMLSDKTEKKVN